jgi:osmotically-inducible protein OsmY
MDALAIEHAKSESPAPPRCQEINLEAEDRFRRSGYFALRDISCDARNGVLHLRGRLPSYYLKQVAQAVAAEVEGVRRVVNRIEVIAPARLAPVECDRATTHCDGLN